MVYAIVRSGGSQQKVAVGDVIEIDKVVQAEGQTVALPAVPSGVDDRGPGTT